ncbi:U5 small nuclear ribonucleoprotein TSSC4 isoform X2 [Haemorhous mexicanus]|uniref:U5 small nuclear ribonucleoprotein TSSC4 isoform X2 n=1 Tax=Haemorhous mexicanus TaxID=30427 RepID=UPI0028BF4927|nr:U5 small nuclear ribonucleoprotein TSSC4 isoform X2 [Haemorhous mexicanus]
MSALRCALGAVVPPLSTASPRSPARKMSSAEARRPPTTPRSPERGGAGKCQEVPALSAPLSPSGVVVLPPLWSLRGAWQGLGVPARRGPWAEGQRWERRARRAAAVEGGSRKAHRVCLSNTRMEEPTGNLPIRRDVILPESCCGHVTITNLH